MLVGIITLGRPPHLLDLRAARRPATARRPDRGRGRAAARRRPVEVGARAVPLLAARCDGRADAGQRLPPRGRDGQGRHLPRRAARPGVRGRPGLARPDGGPRPLHDARRRVAGPAPARHQAAARLRHREPARLHRRHRRPRHQGVGAVGAGPRHRARALQVDALPHGRGRRQVHRHPRPARAVRRRSTAAPGRRAGDARRSLDGRHRAARRVRVQGERPRVAVGGRPDLRAPARAVELARDHRRRRRLGPDGRLHGALPLGRLRHQARRRPDAGQGRPPRLRARAAAARRGLPARRPPVAARVPVAAPVCRVASPSVPSRSRSPSGTASPCR